jgi:hypothetical protein
MSGSKLIPLLFLVLSVAGMRLAMAQVDQNGRRSMTAIALAAEERITLDGVLDEAAWRRAEPASDFIQQEPINGQPATERTEVRIVYTSERLYLGVICFDSDPSGILGYQRRRDELLSSDDRFLWVLDPYLEERGGYRFGISPSGAMIDTLLDSTEQGNRQWDGIWTAKVRQTERGWEAEIELPFQTLNFNPEAPAWGINFLRTVRRKGEHSLWMGHARNQGLERMTNTGRLEGIRGVSQGKGVELKPYVLGTATSSPGTGQNNTVLQGDPGLDVFYNLTPQLRANFTLNTDFAQTEVDDQLVNLTRFPLFFEEKREFFLEGSSFFDFISNVGFEDELRVFPFFSRRIGLSDDREPKQIEFGTRLTGQAGRQDVGFLHVRTGEHDGEVGDDFTVGRLKRRIFDQSYVGGLLTRRAPREDANAHYTVGLDALLASNKFLGSQNLEWRMFMLGASNREGESGDRLAYGMDWDYPNDPWEMSFSFRGVGRNFDPDVGFVARTGYRRYSPRVEYSVRTETHPWVRSLTFGTDLDWQTDQGNSVLTRKLEFKLFELVTQAEDTVSVTVTPTHERLEEDFEISDGVVLPNGAQYDFTTYRTEIQTAERRKLAANASFELGNFFSGKRQQYSMELTLRARPGIIVRAEAELNRVNLTEGKFQTRVYRFKPEWQFSPWMYLVNIFQFDSESRVLGWQGRFRWILRPGNDLYFVYTHNWRDDLDFDRGFRTYSRRAATKFIYTYRF